MRAARPLLIVLTLAAVACGKSKSNETLARIGNETITAEQVNKEAASRVQEIEARFEAAKNDYEMGLYQARLGAIENIVNEKLFEEMGKQMGVSAQEAREKKYQEFVNEIPEPTEQEQRAFYEDMQRQQNGRLEPFEQIQGRVIQYVRQQKAAPAAQAWYDKFKKEKGFALLLDPMRKPVEAKGPSRGNPKAPVTIVEFSDFECPYCSRAEPALAQVLSEYGDKVRIVFRDFPLDFHPHAQKASEAAHCADDQGKYWDMHGKLFTSQQQLDVASLKQHAKALGLDQAKFDQCLDSGAKESVVKEHFKAGKLAGVNATPAFFINGRPLAGAVPVEEFKKIIDDELARN